MMFTARAATTMIVTSETLLSNIIYKRVTLSEEHQLG
jgi:hypothetical protein